MATVWVSHLQGVILFLSLLLIIAASNLFALGRLKRENNVNRLPFVSILVPARNEEANIEACVRSLLAQDYPDFDLLVYDDQSTDQTLAILEKIALDHPRLRIIRGTPLPDGWLGKSWACQQLAEASTGELLLLTDADTRHEPTSLLAGVQTLLSTRSDLVSALPCQQATSLGEQVTVPILYWSIFTFLPVGLAHRLQHPALSAAIGQYMLFRRAAYFTAGGHAAVRLNTADDLALTRVLIRKGLHWRLMDGAEVVTCRMYHGFWQSWRGIGKSLFGAFDYRARLFLPIWLWLGIVFLEPAALLCLILIGIVLPSGILPLASTAVILSLVLWSIFAYRFRQPVWLVLIYPAIVLLACAIALSSWWQFFTGQVVWKGRRLPDQNEE